MVSAIKIAKKQTMILNNIVANDSPQLDTYAVKYMYDDMVNLQINYGQIESVNKAIDFMNQPEDQLRSFSCIEAVNIFARAYEESHRQFVHPPTHSTGRLESKLSEPIQKLLRDLSELPNEKQSQILQVLQKLLLSKEQDNVRVSVELIHSSLDKVIAEYWPGYDSKTGPKPIRIERIRKVILGRENEDICLEEFAKSFGDTINPRKSASNAISWLNTAFRKLDIPLEIHGWPDGASRSYRFRHS